MIKMTIDDGRMDDSHLLCFTFVTTCPCHDGVDSQVTLIKFVGM